MKRKTPAIRVGHVYAHPDDIEYIDRTLRDGPGWSVDVTLYLAVKVYPDAFMYYDILSAQEDLTMRRLFIHRISAKLVEYTGYRVTLSQLLYALQLRDVGGL